VSTSKSTPEQLEGLARLIGKTPSRVGTYSCNGRPVNSRSFSTNSTQCSNRRSQRRLANRNRDAASSRLTRRPVSHALEDMWARPPLPDGFGPPDAEPPMLERY
jgi:hypothetical protein